MTDRQDLLGIVCHAQKICKKIEVAIRSTDEGERLYRLIRQDLHDLVATAEWLNIATLKGKKKEDLTQCIKR